MQIDKKKLLLKDLPSIRQMLAFITVYEYGHMSAAAEELALTQPAVTVLIKELEQKLGVQLFDRATRSLKPTQAAETVLPYVMRALQELGELQTVIRDFTTFHTGSFTLAITPNSAQTVLTQILTAFKQAYPSLQIHILECEPLELMSSLLKEKADLCLGVLEKQLPFIQHLDILNDPIVALYAPHYFPQTALDTWSDLKHEQLILTKKGYGIRSKIDQYFQTLALDDQPQKIQDLTLISTVIALTQSGLGVGLAPYSSVQHLHDQLRIKPLNAPVLYRTISLFHLKEKSLNAAAQAFLDFCEQLNLDR